MPFKAVFLDRDGTLNEDSGYIGDPKDVKLFPGTGEALFNLSKSGFKLIVISNQSGIARGLITKEDVENVNHKINDLLKVNNIKVDAFYYCPAHPDFSTESECECRKPSPYLVFLASRENQIDLERSYFVGDSATDVGCGINAGMRTVLVKTGNGKDALSILQKENKLPSFVAENIFDASNYIVQQNSGA